MDKIKWNSKNVGRCLTEYKREDYDQIIGSFSKFVVASQFDRTYDNISEIKETGSYSDPKVFEEEPKLSFGSILYGVQEDGTLTKIKSIIDSSD